MYILKKEKHLKNDLDDARAFRKKLVALQDEIPLDKWIPWSLGKTREHLGKYPIESPLVQKILDSLSQRALEEFPSEEERSQMVELDSWLDANLRIPYVSYMGSVLLDLLVRRVRSLHVFCFTLVVIRGEERKAQGGYLRQKQSAQRALRKQILKELEAL